MAYRFEAWHGDNGATSKDQTRKYDLGDILDNTYSRVSDSYSALPDWAKGTAKDAFFMAGLASAFTMIFLSCVDNYQTVPLGLYLEYPLAAGGVGAIAGGLLSATFGLAGSLINKKRPR
jgi:hypothetical protein